MVGQKKKGKKAPSVTKPVGILKFFDCTINDLAAAQTATVTSTSSIVGASKGALGGLSSPPAQSAAAIAVTTATTSAKSISGGGGNTANKRTNSSSSSSNSQTTDEINVKRPKVDEKKHAMYGHILSRAEIVDARKMWRKLQKKTQQGTDARDDGEKAFMSLVNLKQFVGRPKTYIAFAEADGEKIEKLRDNGHYDIAIGYMLLKMRYVGKDARPANRASLHAGQKTADKGFDAWVAEEHAAGRKILYFFIFPRETEPTCMKFVKQSSMIVCSLSAKLNYSIYNDH